MEATVHRICEAVDRRPLGPDSALSAGRASLAAPQAEGPPFLFASAIRPRRINVGPVSDKTVYSAVGAGQLRHVRVGRKILIRRDAISGPPNAGA